MASANARSGRDNTYRRAQQAMSELVVARGPDGDRRRMLLPSDVDILLDNPSLCRKINRHLGTALVAQMDFLLDKSYADVRLVLDAAQDNDRLTNRAAMARVEVRCGDMLSVDPADKVRRSEKRDALVKEMKASADALIDALPDHEGQAIVLWGLYVSDQELQQKMWSPELQELTEAIEMQARFCMGPDHFDAHYADAPVSKPTATARDLGL